MSSDIFHAEMLYTRDGDVPFSARVVNREYKMPALPKARGLSAVLRRSPIVSSLLAGGEVAGRLKQNYDAFGHRKVTSYRREPFPALVRA